jgi:hypothetical protein
VTTNNGDAIRNELTDIYHHYRQTINITVEKTKASFQEPRRFEATLTPDAWMRYNLLEATMLEDGLATDRSDMMTPVYDRLSKSILKASVLIAAARQRNETLVVEEIDVLRAIHYGEQWRVHANEVMANVGKGTYERQLDTIARAVYRTPGITRSKIMQWYHLNARTATEILETLEQRGMITRRRAGRTEQLYSTDRTPINVEF